MYSLHPCMTAPPKQAHACFIPSVDSCWLERSKVIESHAVMSENLDLFVLEFGNKIRKLNESQLTAQLIGKIFNIFPDSIFLVASDGTIEVPDECGYFSGSHTYMDYEVQGDSCISRDYTLV